MTNPSIPNTPPATVEQLLQRVQAIAGYNFLELATLANIRIPENLKKEKGWVGQLIERCLGAQEGSKPTQDFPELGIELKTLPIDDLGKALETTYVCYAPLLQNHGITWETSNVRNKLQNVLWLPVQGSREIPLAERVVGSGFLWSPTQLEACQLKADWEELMDLITLGEIESVTAQHGEFMQLRPKAADGSALTEAVGKNGERIRVRPRGFYLRKNFTNRILQQQFGL